MNSEEFEKTLIVQFTRLGMPEAKQIVEGLSVMIDLRLAEMLNTLSERMEKVKKPETNPLPEEWMNLIRNEWPDVRYEIKQKEPPSE